MSGQLRFEPSYSSIF